YTTVDPVLLPTVVTRVNTRPWAMVRSSTENLPEAPARRSADQCCPASRVATTCLPSVTAIIPSAKVAAGWVLFAGNGTGGGGNDRQVRPPFPVMIREGLAPAVRDG